MSALSVRDNLVNENIGLVLWAIQRLKIKNHRTLDWDEAYSAGLEGLLDAASKYKPELGAKFSTYAGHRISGAILDWARSQDVISRGKRKDVRKRAIEVARQEQEEGGKVCEHVDNVVQIPVFTSLDEVLDGESGLTLAEVTAEQPFEITIEDRVLLHRLIGELKGNERKVIELYFFQDICIEDVGLQIGRSRSRGSQIKKDVLEKLRARFLAEKGITMPFYDPHSSLSPTPNWIPRLPRDVKCPRCGQRLKRIDWWRADYCPWTWFGGYWCESESRQFPMVVIDRSAEQKRPVVYIDPRTKSVYPLIYEMCKERDLAVIEIPFSNADKNLARSDA